VYFSFNNPNPPAKEMYSEAGGRQYENRMDMLVEMREERKVKKEAVRGEAEKFEITLHIPSVSNNV
jgi:hypothetical protein